MAGDVPSGVEAVEVPGSGLAGTDLVSRNCSIECSVVDHLVARIRTISREAPLRYALGLGQLIVHTLYGGDLTAWRQRGSKETSFRRLTEHPDLPARVTAVDLYRAVALHELSTRVDILSLTNLGYSHFRAVLSVAPGPQVRLLREAERERWTVRELEARVSEIRKLNPGSRGGRPALPGFVKSLHRLRSLVQEEREMFQDLEALHAMSPQKVRELESVVSQLQDRLDQVRKVLSRATRDP